MPPEGRTSNGLVVTLLNGVLIVEQTFDRQFVSTLIPAEGSGLEKKTITTKQVGVEVEIKMFVNAVQAAKEGRENKEENFGEPRGALWDLSVVEAMLKSNGKEINLESLIKGERSGR